MISRLKIGGMAWLGWWLAPALAVLISGFFIVSKVPGHSGDTIQFQFLSDVYGVPHPPGSPVYILLIWLWRHLIPWGSAALVTNLFSVVAALVVVVAGSRLMSRWNIPSWCAALAFVGILVAPLWLRLSSVAELYVPAMAFGLLAMERAQAWADNGKKFDIILVGVILGMGMGVHPTVLFYGPACLLLILQRERTPWRNPDAWKALLAFTGSLGAVILVVIVAATSDHTAFVWRPFVDFDSGFTFLTAKTFRQDLGAISLNDLRQVRIPLYAESIFSWCKWLAPLVGIGFLVSLKKLRGLAVLSIFLANAAYVIPYDVFDVWDFVLPAQLAVVLWLGLGLQWIVGIKPAHLLWSVILGFVLLAIFGTQLSYLPKRIQSVAVRTHDSFQDKRARHILDLVGPGAVVVSGQWDLSCSLWYWVFEDQEKYSEISIVHVPGMKNVVNYVRGENDLNQKQLQKRVKPGSDVFVLGEKMMKIALENELYVYSLPENLHLLRTAPDTCLLNRWSEEEVIESLPGAFQMYYGQGWGGAEGWGRWMLAEEAVLDMKNVSPHAVLRIKATEWNNAQTPVKVTALLDGVSVGTFVVDTKPWKAKVYDLPLKNAESLAGARLILQVEKRFAAKGDRPRSLAVVSIEISGQGSEKQ